MKGTRAWYNIYYVLPSEFPGSPRPLEVMRSKRLLEQREKFKVGRERGMNKWKEVVSI